MSADIRNWLAALGLDKYADTFVESDIDLEILPELNDDDLKELGVTLGHRKKIAKAFAAFRSESLSPGSTGESSRQTEAERRQLTVMFCDLVGSTALSRQLDPEDLRDVIRRYQDAVAGAVTRYGGHVAQYLGDGVLVYFGWPQAYEDQAERAVRAGIDAVNAVFDVQVDDKRMLSARVGIASGQVVVGDLAGDTDAVTGETPNLAARLQGVAEPGQVVIGENTKLLLGQVFALADLGPQRLKGFDEVQAWRVDHKVATESRFETVHGDTLLPLVGREHELGLLLERWELAKYGKGQVVFLRGEAGIGKSRLVRGLRDTLANAQHFRLRYQCSPLFRNSAFYPVVQRLERAAGFEEDDEQDIKLNKLEALLEVSGGDTASDAPLIAELMSLSGTERYGELALTPQQLRDQAIEAMIRQVIDLSRRRPIFFLLEDAHWVDNSTETLIGEIMARIADAPVIMVITYRPDEYSSPWPELPYSTSIDLKRLPEHHGDSIVRAIAHEDIPKKVIQEILTRADGVPLFVEELTKSLLESSAAGIPSSLQASLMARLDLLGEAKEVAQTGAAIGREFAYEMMAALLDDRRAELPSLLDRLVSSELVYQIGRGEQRKYVFKHALIQDAAYDSMLNARRRDLHGSIARAMIERFPETSAQQPEILARHLSASDNKGAAAEQWRLAGQKAVLLSAMEEAENCYLSGLNEIEEQPQSEAIDRITFDLRLAMASLFFWKEGPKSETAEKAYLLARELGDRFDDVERQNAVSWGLWGLYWNRGDTKKGAPFAYEQLKRLHKGSHPFAVSVAHRSVAVSEMTLGKFEAAAEHADTAYQAILPNDDGQTATRFGHDLNISAHMMLALARGFLGHTDEAIKLAANAVEAARRLGHSATLGYATFFTGLLQLLCRRVIFSATQIDEIEVQKDQIPMLSENWPDIVGSIKVLEGQYAEGVDTMSRWLQDPDADTRPSRVVYGDIAFRTIYAEALLKLQQRNDAASVMSDALRLIDQTGFAWWSAECLRVQGEILRQDGETEAAAMHYSEACAIAEIQQSRLFGLRTATAWARLLQDQGRGEKACDLLRQTIERMPDGDRAPELTEAKAILGEFS